MARRAAAKKGVAEDVAKSATPFNPKVLEQLVAMRQSRVAIRDIRDKMYQRTVRLQGSQAASEEEVDKASMDLEAAKIDLALAEIEILKAQSGGEPQ